MRRALLFGSAMALVLSVPLAVRAGPDGRLFFNGRLNCTGGTFLTAPITMMSDEFVSVPELQLKTTLRAAFVETLTVVFDESASRGVEFQLVDTPGVPRIASPYPLGAGVLQPGVVRLRPNRDMNSFSLTFSGGGTDSVQLHTLDVQWRLARPGPRVTVNAATVNLQYGGPMCLVG